MMKKIGIDARLYSQTGVGTYLRNFLYYLDKKDDNNFIYYIYFIDEDFNKINFHRKNIFKKKADFRWHSFSEQIGFLSLIMKDNLDLMHFTYFSYPVFYPKKFIATIHDLTPLFLKTGKASMKYQLIYKFKHIALSFVLKNQVKKAKVILTPSFTVKRQIIDYYGEAYKKKIFPFLLGVDYQLIKEREYLALKNKFPFNFFIYVGNFYPHKNIERLINVFLMMEKSVKLILIGPEDFFSQKIKKLIDHLNLKKKIIVYHPKDKSDLIFFYKNALALIHPSLSEGFGLPLIEAAYFNCPIIASDIPVFREILGKNYLSFNPKNEIDIKEKIIFFLKKKPQFDYKKIIHQYSFKKMTDKILKIYQKLTK